MTLYHRIVFTLSSTTKLSECPKLQSVTCAEMALVHIAGDGGAVES